MTPLEDFVTQNIPQTAHILYCTIPHGYMRLYVVSGTDHSLRCVVIYGYTLVAFRCPTLWHGSSYLVYVKYNAITV